MTQKIFPADKNALNEVLEFIESELEKINCPAKKIMSISVAIEEIFVNIACYSYGQNKGYVRVGFGFDSNTNIATFQISDKGIPFNPLKQSDPDITLSAEERQIGGLGIFIAKKTMDNISYAYKNDENILTMQKIINQL
ncbi:MAG: ATP-binding protein [Ruminococcus sp.]|nr:ATP-binding protein [Ruminococcus sp.]